MATPHQAPCLCATENPQPSSLLLNEAFNDVPSLHLSLSSHLTRRNPLVTLPLSLSLSLSLSPNRRFFPWFQLPSPRNFPHFRGFFFNHPFFHLLRHSMDYAAPLTCSEAPLARPNFHRFSHPLLSFRPPF
jgi:hypothetical protein